MKQSRMARGSSATALSPLAVVGPLALVGPLAGIVVSLAGAFPARGHEVPFTERVISTTVDGAFYVFATDLDGDGDTDVLSASYQDDEIAWYENDGGSPPSFTERVISTSAISAHSVFATDLDGDGDIDVLSASWEDDKIAWYENTPSDQCVFDADADGDVDLDDFALFQAAFTGPR